MLHAQSTVNNRKLVVHFIIVITSSKLHTMPSFYRLRPGDSQGGIRSLYSSHLNFRRCYRLTRHPHVPLSTLRWLVVAVPSRKSHCCEYINRTFWSLYPRRL